MIRLDAIPPPPDADEIREEELERLRRDFFARGVSPSSDDFGRLYCGRGKDKPWRALLRDGQHRKCAFCEYKTQESFNDVDHFRPKARRTNFENKPEDLGYWWLAWTWENLVFSCPNCNRKKGSLFPLTRRSRPLQAEEQAPGAERPLLIDPRRESAVVHVQFKLVEGAPPDTWKPYPRGNSPWGAMTIRCMTLDRDELVDLYRDHAGNLRPDIDELRAILQSRHEAQITDRWSRVTRRWIECKTQPFRALSHDILDHHFGRVVRDRYQLPLPQP